MKKKSIQSVVDIVGILVQLGLRDVVLSPGSRNAPLTIAFVRHPDVKTYTISDERAAAFVGLGMAQQSSRPVAVVCTSGSAALNYGPAISEAFYQQVPLLVLTADRPPEWVDQQDGQTIRQAFVHKQHTKGSYQLPASPVEHPDAAWQIRRQTSEAFYRAVQFPAGPIHLNIPFREPFYPPPDEQLDFSVSPRFFEEWEGEKDLSKKSWEVLSEELHAFDRVLVVAGQQRKPSFWQGALDTLPLPIVADVISNFYGARNAVRHQDAFLMSASLQEKLRPDLLITFGGSVISKNLKLFLRKYTPKAHWHVRESGSVADTYRALTRVVRVSPERFWEELSTRWTAPDTQHVFLNAWKDADKRAAANHARYFQQQETFGEMEAVHRLMGQLPEKSVLHLANSMPVRYANFIALRGQVGVEVFANRGTSGIDGCSSTAIGHALAEPNKLHFLITGDLAFFYDRNAFWHNYLPANLRVVLLNNQGGVIFRMIKGPLQQPELEEYFVTQQRQTAARTAEDFGLSYTSATDRQGFMEKIPDFLAQGKSPKIMEVLVDGVESQRLFEQYKKRFQG